MIHSPYKCIPVQRTYPCAYWIIRYAIWLDLLPPISSSMDKSESESVITDESSTEKSESESVHKSINKNKEKYAIDEA